MTRAKPPRQPMVPCPHCGTQNDPARGSALCRSCHKPLSGSVATADVTPFQFPATGQDVRTVQRDGEPWFVATDVCAVLDIAQTASSLRLLDDDEKGVHSVHTLGGEQVASIVSESGLYSLILRSRKPEAKAFKRWITHEVLPSIRQTGGYQIDVPRTLPDALRAYATEVEAHEATKTENAKLRVKADQFDSWLNGKGCYLIGTVGKMLGVKPKALWDFLYAEKILINSPDTKRHREPYSRPDTHGWFEVTAVPPERANGHATRTTYLTPYGAEQVRLRLIKRGLLPHEQLALISGGL